MSKKICNNKNREFKISALYNTFYTSYIKLYTASNASKTYNYYIHLDSKLYNSNYYF